jgi:hypothetical protein
MAVKLTKLVLEGLFGTVNKVVSTTELQEKKQLADLKIFCLILKHGAIECKHVSGMNYQEEMDYIVQSEKRNKFIVNLCVKITRQYTYVYFSTLKSTEST